ncbi:MAG: hypothetical protein R2932_34470 [Caldilineaceae bacterium]
MTNNQPNTRPKVAAVCTEVRKFAHAQHFLDRFLEGYGWDSRHHRPPFDLVSLYVDQVPEGDLSRERGPLSPPCGSIQPLRTPLPWAQTNWRSTGFCSSVNTASTGATKGTAALSPL